MKLDAHKPTWRVRRLGSIAAAAAVLFVYLSPAVRAQRLDEDQFRNGSSVRKAFRQVVAEARQSTVRVRSDGKDAALGVIVDAAGFILTKASELTDSIECRLESGRELPARLVGVHRDYDLAMLKIDAENLPVVKWSDEDDAAVGAWLATAGLAADPVSVGVVSVPRRSIPQERAVLGIAIEDADAELGAKVTQVFPNSGAARAGLKEDDVITRVAGQAVKSREALIRALGAYRPGDTLELSIRRGDDEKSLRATLGDPVSSIPSRANVQNQLGGRLSRRRAGFEAVLQHDTVLPPQDCGGVVVGLDGRAVGVNIARAGRIETYAIPAAVIISLLDDLKSGKLAPNVVAAETSAPPADAGK